MSFTKLGSLQLNDWWKALVLAVISLPLGILYDWATIVNYEFTGRSMVKGAVAGGVGYLIKNLLTGSQGNLLSNK